MRKKRQNREGWLTLGLLLGLAGLSGCGTADGQGYCDGNLVVSSRGGLFALDIDTGERIDLAPYESSAFPPLLAAAPDRLYVGDPFYRIYDGGTVSGEGDGLLMLFRRGEEQVEDLEPFSPWIYRPRGMLLANANELIFVDPVGNPDGLGIYRSGIYRFDIATRTTEMVYYGPELMTVTDAFYDGDDLIFVDKDSDPFGYGMCNGVVFILRAGATAPETLVSLPSFMGPEALVRGPDRTFYLSNDRPTMMMMPIEAIEFYQVEIDTGASRRIAEFRDFPPMAASNSTRVAMTLGPDENLYFIVYGIRGVDQRVYRLEPDSGRISVFYDGGYLGPDDFLYDIDTIPEN